MDESLVEKTETEEQFASFKFPALINFYKFTGIPRFENTEEWQLLMEKIEKWVKNEEDKKKSYKKLKIYFLLLFFISLFFLGFCIVFLNLNQL